MIQTYERKKKLMAYGIRFRDISCTILAKSAKKSARNTLNVVCEKVGRKNIKRVLINRKFNLKLCWTILNAI